MTEAKCDLRIVDLFTKGCHHRNVSILYLTQNVFPQGKACRDISLNTQYLVLFNNSDQQINKWRPWQEEFIGPLEPHFEEI